MGVGEDKSVLPFKTHVILHVRGLFSLECVEIVGILWVYYITHVSLYVVCVCISRITMQVT